MFAMDAPYEPATGIRRFLSGSPNIPGIVAVEEGVKLLQEAGPENLRAKSVALTEFLIGLADEWLSPLGFSVASPRDSIGRGGHVVLAHEEAYRISQAAIDAGLIVDGRPPGLLGLCPAPLTNSFVDVWDALMRLHEVVNGGAHLAVSGERPKVT
jgi:kynureninase